MFQRFFSKITTCLVIVSMVLCVLFFAGCGNKEEEDKSNLPQVPSVGGNDGKLENNGGENKAVTKGNLPQFVEELEAAMLGDGSGAAKTRDAAEDEREIDTTEDGRGGSRITDILFIGGSEANATASVKFFNFSKSGKLFLGGGIGAAIYYDEVTNEQEMKVNGEIKFNGIFNGSVVYKNYYQKYKFSGNAKEGTLTTKLVNESGDVVVKSGGSEIPFKEYAYIFLDF